MKKQFLKDFLLRGLTAAAGGPVVLSIIYAILGHNGTIESLSPAEVSTGVLSITLMAFIAGGITAVYQVEQLPLPMAIASHGAVLYLDYLLMYLLNNWIPRNGSAIGFFTAVFAAGFAAVWVIIWLVNRMSAKHINQKMQDR